jgi:cation transport ATPase
MEQEQQEPEKPLLSPDLEPVKHLSPRLQRKLLKREQKQRKHFRSLGKPYPLVTMASSSTSMEAPATGSTLRSRQRLILAIASLITVMLLALALVGIVIATHAAGWIFSSILFVIAMFIAAAVVINILFSRKNFH